MSVNSSKPELWKSDIAKSVDFYNNWFMTFAPKAYRETRHQSTLQVEEALKQTANLTDVTAQVLKLNPGILQMLRMATAPPIARDRLIGLANVSKNLVINMEDNERIPPKMSSSELEKDLTKISALIMQLADRDIFTWLESNKIPEEKEVYRAATIVADRLCGSQSDPIIRNAQEERQLTLVKKWLEQKGYRFVEPHGNGIRSIANGTFAFHLGVPVTLPEGNKEISVSIDIVVMPKTAPPNSLPLLIEAKSAGDFTNPNKRRKEEAIKIAQLRSNYGSSVKYILFLCGYFDSGYLGYEAAEGIDWIWEHRIDDLASFGV